MKPYEANLSKMADNRGAVVVSVGLQLNPTLLRLNLFPNIFGDSGVAVIAEALKVNSSLQTLNLRSNRITESGAAALAESLKVNASLQKLDLGWNNIGDSGAVALAEALKVNSSLKQLHIHGIIQIWRFWCHGFGGLIDAEHESTGAISLLQQYRKFGSYGRCGCTQGELVSSEARSPFQRN
jgi:hypothetical protein